MVTERPNVKPEAKYGIKEAAELLGVTRNTIYNYRTKGLLKFEKRRACPRFSFVSGREILKLWGGLL